MSPFKRLFLVLALLGFGDAWANWPPSQCTHVVVLDAGDTDQVSWRFDGGITARGASLTDAGDYQLATLAVALDMLPDILCQAVRKVAFIDRPSSPGVSGWSTSNDRQSVIYLNATSASPWHESNLRNSQAARLEAIHRVVHESTHAAVRLLQSVQRESPVGALQERPDPDLWPANAQALAKEIIALNRLDSGVLREWQRLHEAFIPWSMAQAYFGSDWRQNAGLAAADLAKAGFMSAYGGESPIEDLAEFASWALVRGVVQPAEDAACKVMSGRADASVKSEDAAVFAKLGFVHTLGFISDQAYKGCAGQLEIRGNGAGFHSFKSGNPQRSYTANLEAGTGRAEDGGPMMFQISAEGTVETTAEVVPVKINLMLNVSPPETLGSSYADLDPDDVSLPRGIYPVGFKKSKYNRMTIFRKDNNKLIMDVGQGIVLVGRSSKKLVEGSVVVQRFFNYSGGLLSSIAGDEVVKEPTTITFRLER